MSKFCYHPWVGLDIDPMGVFTPCCKFSTPVADNISDYQNSELMERVRNQFIRGEQPSECARCWRDEAAGIKSKRELDFHYLFNNTPPDLSSIKILMMTFGNTCNLACRICGSHTSSSWRTEEKKLISIFPETRIHQHNRFYQDKQFMTDIREHVKDVTHVGFPGGEPFIAGIDEHLEFLDFLITKNPGNVSLHYITNTTRIPSEEFWTRWNKFKRVEIQLSIDGIEDHFEYNRWPAKWSECLPNILAYRDRMSDKLQISISHTVSIFTIFYLPEFLKWCFKNKMPIPYLGLLNEPSHYDIRALPLDVKQAIAARLVGPLLEPISKAMMSQDFSSEFDKTIQYIKILDNHRNQCFADTFPELYQLIGAKWAI